MGSGTLEELLGSDANCDLLSSYWHPGIATYGKAPSKNGLAPSGSYKLLPFIFFLIF